MLQLIINNSKIFKILCKRITIIFLTVLTIKKHNNNRVLLVIKEQIAQKAKLYKKIWNKQMMILKLIKMKIKIKF